MMAPSPCPWCWALGCQIFIGQPGLLHMFCLRNDIPSAAEGSLGRELLITESPPALSSSSQQIQALQFTKLRLLQVSRMYCTRLMIRIFIQSINRVQRSSQEWITKRLWAWHGFF